MTIDDEPLPRSTAIATGSAVLGVGGILLGALALAVALGSGDGDTDDGTTDVVVERDPQTVTLDVEAGDLFFSPDTVTVTEGDDLVIDLVNIGAIQHDLKLDDGRGSAILQAGESETVELGAMTESTTAFCSIPGHREAGMEFEIVVEGAAPAPVDAETASTDTGPANAVIDFNAEPGIDWMPFDPTLEPAPGGTEHELTLVATEEVIEVAPGVTQEMWVFNGTFPGPVLRGKVGDVFTVTVENRGRIGHSIDFHASRDAWDDEMRTLQPGERLTYQFEATNSGIYMYHCGTAPTLHHIGNGMHGGIIIDPPDLPEVDHEFVFVQSEIYTGPEGRPGDLEKMIDDDWDAVVFNGYVNQYKYAPVRVEVGERIRAWVLNNGPSENSSFHVVGTIFDTVYKEGAYLLQPGPLSGGSQAVDLMPAQGGFVEFELSEDGLYPIVTHKFSNVGKGAIGLFQAGEPVDRSDDGVVTSIPDFVPEG